MLLLDTLLVGILLIWMGIGVFTAWSIKGVKVFRPGLASPPLDRTPRVSILVAARNEEETLEATLQSLFTLEYPDYEVILLDDASQDRTGAIADAWARRPEASGRLKVIHNRDLPAGWSGKVHALSLAARTASGEWVLATDADVVFNPAVLRVALSFADREKVQLLSLFPEVTCQSFWDKVVLPSFSFLLFTLYPIRLVNHPRFSRAMAAGAFILMRREDLEALGGYDRLRDVVIEDVRMAELFKRNGRRIFLAATRGLLRTRPYRSVGEMWESLSRSAYEGSGYSVLKILTGILVGTILAVLPWVAAIALACRDALRGLPWTASVPLLLSLAACALSSLVYLPVLIALRVSPLYIFSLPLGGLFYVGVAVNSAWRSIFGGGVPWKGRRYRPGG